LPIHIRIECFSRSPPIVMVARLMQPFYHQLVILVLTRYEDFFAAVCFFAAGASAFNSASI
jgi:hypothetical protein